MNINLGSGKRKAEGWIGLDKNSSCDITFDFEKLEPLPFENDSVDIAYSNHVIEHLTDEADRHLFKEVYRVLRQGGLFRIVTPDFEVYWKCYQQGDIELFKQFRTGNGKAETVGDNIAEHFVNSFISYNILDRKKRLRKRCHKIPSVRDFDERLHSEFNYLATQKDKEHFIQTMKQYVPTMTPFILHRNIFNYFRLEQFLHDAGFDTIYASDHNQSRRNEINHLEWDRFPDRSMHVEAVK